MAEQKEQKSPEAKQEARKALLTLLLIVLVGIAILWFGFDLAIGIVAFVLWVIGRVTGVA